MSLERDLAPDASCALAHDALERAARLIEACGVEFDSILLLTMHKTDEGKRAMSAVRGGSLKWSTHAAKTFLAIPKDGED